MTAGYCRHEWTTRNEVLRVAFPSHAGMERDFRVCQRCLRIEELAATPETAPFEPAREKSPGGSGEGDEQAA